MATLVKSGTPTLVTPAPPASCKHSGLLCGEDIEPGDACYIKSDGKVWKTNGTSANAAAECHGYALQAAKVAQNDAVTLVADVDMAYGSGLTPGAKYYASATAGALDDAATTGGTKPIAYAVTDKIIRLLRSRY